MGGFERGFGWLGVCVCVCRGALVGSLRVETCPNFWIELAGFFLGANLSDDFALSRRSPWRLQWPYVRNRVCS